MVFSEGGEVLMPNPDAPKPQVIDLAAYNKVTSYDSEEETDKKKAEEEEKKR